MHTITKGDFMVKNDTVELLKECNAGIKMGISTIDGVMPRVTSNRLETILHKYREKHEQLGNETRRLLDEYGEKGKEPNAMAKGMAWLKTNTKMFLDESDNTVSDLITDGCNMGVKTVNRYINQYDAADEKSKKLAKELINIETELAVEISPYL